MKENKQKRILAAAFIMLAILAISNFAFATTSGGGAGGITAIGATLDYGNIDLSEASTVSGADSVPAFGLATDTAIIALADGTTTDLLLFVSESGFEGLYFNGAQEIEQYDGDSFTLNSVEYTISRTSAANAYRISTTEGATIMIGTQASSTIVLPDNDNNVKIMVDSRLIRKRLPATVVFNSPGISGDTETGAAGRVSVSGAASEGAAPGCTDNDENEDESGIYASSHVSVVSDDGNETITADYCARSGDVTRLYEAVCTREDTATVRMVVCPEDKVCRAGACTEPDAAIAGKYCLDSDIMTADTAESLGRTAATKGTTVGFYTSTYAANQEGREFGAWSDYCRDEKTLIEYYCSEESRQGMFREIICLNDCEGGKCEDPPYCYDSDGGAYASVQGTIRGVNETGEYFAKTDSCKDTSAVIEYACVASSISGSAAGQECQIGTTIGTTCASGYCKTMYGQQGEITSMVCADCQGDADCSPGKVCWQGACVEADENYVANGFVSYEIACGDGKYCSEGRCVSGVAPTPVCLQCDPLNKFNIRQGTDCNDDGTPSEWTLKRCPAGQICSADRCVPEPKSTIAEVTTAFNNRKKWALLLNETLGWIETAEQIPPLIEAASGSYTDTLEQIAAGLNSLQALMLRGQIGVDPGIEADIGLELFP